MKTFTAKTLHDNPSEVYRAAVKEPVKITHKHHGDLLLMSEDSLKERIELSIQSMRQIDDTGNFDISDYVSSISGFIVGEITNETSNKTPCGWGKDGRYYHPENLKLNNHIHGDMDSYD